MGEGGARSAAQDSTSGFRPSRASSDGTGGGYKTFCEPKRGFMGKWAAGKESGQKCYATYPATPVAGLRAVIPSIRREIPVVNRFKPNIAPMAPVEFHGR